jgi:UDP-N-acetylmuramoyl-tripeptide--D-alanyl-D-alanine ligase
MTIEQLYQLFLAFPTVCTDTRKITQDCLFFALKGDHFNGNQFAGEALGKGAAYAIVDEREYGGTPGTVLVDNCLHTLQQLATHHRKQCSAQIIGLTGSNGKTTTKELIKTVLAKKYRTVATQGNLNNHIGVPLTLLSIQDDTQIAIVEMGANHPGEIAFLSGLAEPDFGYITNFGKAHLEGFGSAGGVIAAKSELYTFLRDHDRPVFFNADDPVQSEKLKHHAPTFGFSSHDQRFYVIKNLGARPFVALEVEGVTIFSQLIGTYNFTNCCAAILIGHYFGVPLGDIKEAIERYTPHNNRSQLIVKNGNDIILDAYNANPTSLRAALENFDLMEGKEKIVFIGDMFELGEAAAEEHQYIADLAGSMSFEKVYLIGENFYRAKGSHQKFRSFEALAEELQNTSLKNKQILIKGSRGMALERILDVL